MIAPENRLPFFAIMAFRDHALTSLPPTHPQLAVSAVIFRDGKILLVRRAGSPARGFYSLPGGRVEFGETLQDALHREVDEETHAFAATFSISFLSSLRWPSTRLSPPALLQFLQ